MIVRHAAIAARAAALVSAFAITACHHPAATASASAHAYPASTSGVSPFNLRLPTLAINHAPAAAAPASPLAVLTKAEQVITARVRAVLPAASGKALVHRASANANQRVAKHVG